LEKLIKEQQALVYNCFIRALRHILETDKTIRPKALARKALLSESYISQILNNKKQASFDAQIALSTALGMTYLDVLSMGQRLESGGNPDIPPRVVEPTPTKTIHELLKMTRFILESGEVEFSLALSHTIRGFTLAMGRIPPGLSTEVVMDKTELRRRAIDLIPIGCPECGKKLGELGIEYQADLQCPSCNATLRREEVAELQGRLRRELLEEGKDRVEGLPARRMNSDPS